VILGSGAFACEAMEAAIANNAKHVTMVCRDRKRWALLLLSRVPNISWGANQSD